MTVSVETDEQFCSEYVEPFLEETPHAAPPANNQDVSWVNFGIAEAGQVEMANRDKANAAHVLTVCERNQQKAQERSRKRARKWWQIF